jgi:hypothetical protein
MFLKNIYNNFICYCFLFDTLIGTSVPDNKLLEYLFSYKINFYFKINS